MNRYFASARYAIRQFRKTPAFTATAVLTLAIGIGGATAIFTLIDAVMMRSLPVADPASLYRIGEGDDCCVEGGPQDKWGMYSFPLFERLRDQAPEFAQITAFQAGMGRMTVRRAGSPEAAKPLRSEYVSGEYFSVFGIGALGGRVITPDDDRPGAPAVAVLSHYIWETAYGADPSVVGSSFLVEGHPFTIVGIAPPGFFGDTLRSDPPEIWLPLHQAPVIAGDPNTLNQPVSAWLRAIGRLRPGASTAGMTARLTATLRRWLRYESQYPANWMADVISRLPRQEIAIVPAGAGVADLKEAYERSLHILLIVCGLVLLIACSNVANLLLVRSVARRSQTALRLAVGATRRQIVMQALAESTILALAGGIAGLLVSMAAARLLLSLAFSAAHFLPISVTPSLPILAFAFGLSLLTAVIFGAAPAWLATRTDPAEALRGLGRGTNDRSSAATRIFLIAQATLSVVLIAGAAMLSRSLSNLEHQDLGYQIKGRAVVAINGPPNDYNAAKLNALYRRLEDRLNQVPGVRGSGLALYNPLTNNWGELIMVAGHPPGKMDSQSGASWDRVSASYLKNFGVQVLRGRDFTEADNENAAPVALVNEAFVHRFFAKNEDPLDHHFGLDLPENASIYRIIGIVHDAKFAGFGLDRPARPMFCVPLAQTVAYTNPMMSRLESSTHRISGFMLVTDLAPGDLEPVLTKLLAEVDPNLTLVNVRTMQDQVALTFNRQRAVAGLAGLFGIIAVLLAAVGIYGVTAYGVERRTAEIGVRMALGADRFKVIAMVLRSASVQVVAGILLGVPLAIGAGRLLAAELYNVSGSDPLALILAAAALTIFAFFAALIPARRAASIAPTAALRVE